jgi:hypothetical protein
MLPRRHCHSPASPVLVVEHGLDDGDTAALAGETADHLRAPAGLTEGALDQVGVADAVGVLSRKTKAERKEVKESTRHATAEGQACSQLAQKLSRRLRHSPTARWLGGSSMCSKTVQHSQTTILHG